MNNGNGVMKTSEWFVTMLIASIPVVGLIMLVVWAASSGTNENKSNWAKAALLWIVILTVLTFLFWGILAAALMSSMGSL